MPTITEIAPQLFRIATYVPEGNLQFIQFLARDDEPLLFHTGPRLMFPLVRDAVASLLPPERLRWIAFSHFEADECGSLNDWLGLAPQAQALCTFVAKIVSVDDFALRPARALAANETLTTGALRWQLHATPHVPHNWEAGLLFEETQRVLLCSDLFHQNGDVEPLIHDSVIDRVRETLRAYEAGPLAHYLPYTPYTGATLERLAALQPRTTATMHGSTFLGDGAQALRDLGGVLREILG
jgi:flavorubredoxin